MLLKWIGFVSAAFGLVLVGSLGCGGTVDPNATPGCQAGNRSQCVTQVALGNRFGCALLFDHTVWCWGRNDESQLGYATTDLCPDDLPNGQTQSAACHTFPFQVHGLDHVTALVAGAEFTCALRDDQTVLCWGGNAAGQLGNGQTKPSAQPAAVSGLTGVKAIAVGGRHACALASGNVTCWGANDLQQLGAASSSQQCNPSDGMVGCETVPHMVGGMSQIKGRVVDLAAGVAHTCARTDTGSVYCWGDNRYGQLGVGEASDAPSAMPRQVFAGHHPQFASSISAGAYHTCTVREDGAVFCWGRDDHGELGVAPVVPTPDHCAAPCSPSPIVVATLPGAPTHWNDPPDAGSDAGSDAGAFDGGVPVDLAMPPPPMDATVTPPPDAAVADAPPPDLTPIPVVAPPAPPRQVAAGGSFACARLDDGTLRCWGNDADGQLGDGQRTMTPQLPVAVIAQPGAARGNPLQSVTSVATGGSTACALLVDGSLRCWGANKSGALGNGNFSPQSGPVPVSW